MKAVYVASVAIFLSMVSVQAQPHTGGGAPHPFAPPPYYGGYPYSYHSSTAAEGYARGMGDVIRSWGRYNVDTSEAAANLTEARRQQIENNKLYTEAYFQKRAINRQHRQAELERQRQSQANWVRYGQAGKPKALTSAELDPVTGKLHWPMLLTGNEFASQRVEVQKLFSARAKNGVLNADEYRSANMSINRMISALKARIAEFPPQQYMAAKTFLESLSYAAGHPAG